MGVWPFQRRNNRRNSHGGAEFLKSEGRIMQVVGSQPDPGRQNGGGLSSAGPERRRSRKDRDRKPPRESKKLQRSPRRTYSFSPGRNDSILVARDHDRPPVPAIPVDIEYTKPNRAFTEKPQATSVGEKPLRARTQPQEPLPGWERMPTLHKRTAQDVGRRKSSKKRKEEHDREAEIKAMVAFMPTRPAADPTSSGRLVKRETKKMRGGLNAQEKSSDISLPLAGSIHSSLSGSENQTYKLSAFDMLAPRPTIKYAEPPRNWPTSSLDRSETKKRRVSDRVPLPDEILKANKRIDDLADDLDAGELRELMERDQKRREQKKIAERKRAEKKLARRQEKQAEAEATAAREGTPPPDNLERGVLGREVIGLGIGTSAVVTSSRRRDSTDSESEQERRPTEAFHIDSTPSIPPHPSDTAPRSASVATENLTPTSEHDEPEIGVAKVGTVAKASISPHASPRGHARGASSISQMIDLAKTETEKPERLPKPLPPSSNLEDSRKPPHSSWTSFFKRNSKAKQRDSTTSSFSNTSRDSMQVAAAPSASTSMGYTPMRAASNVPKRTMSKFREDLPEFPMSPPDSRVQSPEADVVPPIQTDFGDKKAAGRISTDDPRVRYDTPTSGHRSIDTTLMRDETPTSRHRSSDAPSPEPAMALSQSLASIDSEGSWLSGRGVGSKRGSVQVASHPLRDSASSLQKRYKEYSESAEELGIAEDEYFSRLSPEPGPENKNRRQSGAPMPSSDEEDASMASPDPSEKSRSKWGAVARQPTVVHRGSRIKSKEGLLNEFDDDSGSDGTPQDSSRTERRKSYGFDKAVIEEQEPGVHRATSVDLGRGHVRHISAGSARLLDLKRKSSTDAKRMSSG